MNTITKNESKASRNRGQEIWNEWTRLWNGEYGLADNVVGESLDLHLTAGVHDDPASIHDAATVASWIREVRGKFKEITYSTVAGPFVDSEAQVVSCAWEARGIYAGKTGLPADEPGKTFHLLGMDILTISDGKISDVRTISNPA